jgi:hypothetical protein
MAMKNLILALALTVLGVAAANAQTRDQFGYPDDPATRAWITSYFATHPDAQRPDECALPLRNGFLAACKSEIQNAETLAAAPNPEWHRVATDTVACINALTSTCREVYAGQVLLIGPANVDGKFLPPLAMKYAVTTSGWFMPTSALDPTILHCQVKPVLLHEEVTCSD